MHKIPSEIAIGTDLELFLYDNQEARIVPCVGILEGTKDKPFRPEKAPAGYAIQEDNVMVEFNIPPAKSSSAFRSAVTSGYNIVLKELYRRYNDRYSLFTGKHHHTFLPQDLVSKQAQTIGCEPDFDAYAGGQVRVNPPTPGLMRSCGGHIHLGGDFQCPDFVAALFAELFIGIAGGSYIDAKDPRAAWYGMPGIYRPKPYGIEYRTPNNSWAWSALAKERVSVYALSCASYLTRTSAIELQAAFRSIPWVKVRESLCSNLMSTKAIEDRIGLVNTARKAGVPV